MVSRISVAISNYFSKRKILLGKKRKPSPCPPKFYFFICVFLQFVYYFFCVLNWAILQVEKCLFFRLIESFSEML